MTDTPDAAALRALAQRLKGADAPELLPPARREDLHWSAADAASVSRLIDAIIRESERGIHPSESFEAGRLASGCPEDVFAQITEAPDFEERFRSRAHKLVTLPRLATALRTAMDDGGAFGAQVAHNLAPKSPLSSEEAALHAALQRMTRGELLAEVRRRKAVLEAYEARLIGGTPPPPDTLAAIAIEVTGELVTVPPPEDDAL